MLQSILYFFLKVSTRLNSTSHFLLTEMGVMSTLRHSNTVVFNVSRGEIGTKVLGHSSVTPNTSSR
jgi:hypothetical protein